MKLSRHAKAVVAAVVAVLYAGLLAWQTATGNNGFQPTDLFPVTAAVGAAILTWLVPILPEFPHAKTLVAGFLQAIAAVGVLYENDGVAPNVAAVLLAVAGTVAVHTVTNSTAPTSGGEHVA